MTEWAFLQARLMGGPFKPGIGLRGSSPAKSSSHAMSPQTIIVEKTPLEFGLPGQTFTLLRFFFFFFFFVEVVVEEIFRDGSCRAGKAVPGDSNAPPPRPHSLASGFLSFFHQSSFFFLPVFVCSRGVGDKCVLLTKAPTLTICPSLRYHLSV